MVITRPISGDPIVVNPVGGGTGLVTGGLTSGVAMEVTAYPQQIIGLVALNPCDDDVCRVFPNSCYLHPAFGSPNVNTSSYENDVNQWYVSDGLFRATFWYLQKANPISGLWEDVARVGSTVSGYTYDDDYGDFYNYNHWTPFPYYQGFQINWGHVVTLEGPGIYRVKVKTPDPSEIRQVPFPYCLASDAFLVMPWDCIRARGTAKWEAFMSGRIGSITQDGFVFDLCNISLYDSNRYYGFFGKEKTTYDEILREYQTGKIDRVRDEAIQHFIYSITRPTPKDTHDRFKAYVMMSDFSYVSDYNINNSDWNIKKKSVVKAGPYEPKYYERNRLSVVTCEFKEGIQSVIKSTSCQKSKL